MSNKFPNEGRWLKVHAVRDAGICDCVINIEQIAYIQKASGTVGHPDTKAMVILSNGEFIRTSETLDEIGETINSLA